MNTKNVTLMQLDKTAIKKDFLNYGEDLKKRFSNDSLIIDDLIYWGMDFLDNFSKEQILEDFFSPDYDDELDSSDEINSYNGGNRYA